MRDWHPTTWQGKPCAQQVQYPSQQALNDVIQQLQQLPPLVTALEVEALRSYLAEAALGKRFILQGGDCAESFYDCHEQNITNKLRILLQMSLILVHGLHKPITRVGRIAGQYAKPRSSDMETKANVTLPSYRGDIINAPEFTEQARTPDPQRMLQGYHCAGLTLNYIRALINSGFANLYHADYWNLDFAKHSSYAGEYQKIVDSIQQALRFIKTIGDIPDSLTRVEFYTSHEALHLPYEQALTRKQSNGSWYNLGTHFPWLGMRTATLDGAHIEYLRGIANPVAVKIGPSADAAFIRALVETLNPDNQPGRLTLVTRFGRDAVAEKLPPLIEAVQTTGLQVLWSCDPMHGNTTQTQQGYKTRNFNAILSELEQAFQIHQQCNSHLGGVHFELTGENVTECTGGARGLKEADLKQAYKTLVDPRLNYEQSLEMAMLIISGLRNTNHAI